MKAIAKYQAGQTLIETLVAAVVLTMGISAAVGLAIYGLGATSGVNKQLIASGLAREGIEAVKNMRDTNWLLAPIAIDCFNFYTQFDDAICYPTWLSAGGGYNIDPGASAQTYALGSTIAASNSYWTLLPTSTLFGLNYSPSNQANGLYSIGSSGMTVANSNSKFGRKITISADTFPPFDVEELGPRLKVRVEVWWNDRRCPVSDDVPATSKCLVTLETYLTNWKNF